MFLDLATETGKGDWSVIRGFILLSLFEDRCDISYPPVPWNCSGVEAFRCSGVEAVPVLKLFKYSLAGVLYWL